MTKDQVITALTQNGFVLDGEKAIQYGVQLRFTNGSLVSVYDKGTVTPQGKDVELVKQILGLEPSKNGGSAQAIAPAKQPFNNRVFVVYGHDDQRLMWLDALEEAGVDNWACIEDAIRIYKQWIKEAKEKDSVQTNA